MPLMRRHRSRDPVLARGCLEDGRLRPGHEDPRRQSRFQAFGYHDTRPGFGVAVAHRRNRDTEPLPDPRGSVRDGSQYVEAGGAAGWELRRQDGRHDRGTGEHRE